MTLNRWERRYSSVSAWERNSFPSASWRLNTWMSSRRSAQILGSSCRREPAAALRGLAMRGFPWSSRMALISSNTERAIYTSPRTMSRGSLSGRTMGMERTVFKFSVTSSPTRPSPRVAPRTNTPSRYSRATDKPSTLGSTEYSTMPPRASSMRSQNSATSSSLNTSWRLSSGTSWA